MKSETFSILAEPNRLRILDQLLNRKQSVNELVKMLKISQPAVSKHLKVMRDAGVVSCTIAAQQRIYYIESEPFEEIDRWLEPYRHLWTRHLDALERHLDNSSGARRKRGRTKRTGKGKK